MTRFLLLREAENDLIEIWRYIAEDDQEAATRVLLSLDAKFHLLATASWGLPGPTSRRTCDTSLMGTT
jgi:plasmid stabilization system protein ParE